MRTWAAETANAVGRKGKQIARQEPGLASASAASRSPGDTRNDVVTKQVTGGADDFRDPTAGPENARSRNWRGCSGDRARRRGKACGGVVEIIFGLPRSLNLTCGTALHTIDTDFSPKSMVISGCVPCCFDGRRISSKQLRIVPGG